MPLLFLFLINAKGKNEFYKPKLIMQSYYQGFHLNYPDQSISVSEPEFKVIPITYMSEELRPVHPKRHKHKHHQEQKKHHGILVTFDDPRKGHRRSMTRVG